MGARLLQVGIINHADDQGRMKANPIYLRAQIFPYDDISPKQIQEWLELMAKNGTIILYEVDSRLYVQLTNWWRYQSLQYAQPSQYPRPSGWLDRIRRTLTKGMIVTCNWQRVNGEPIEDTCDMDGNALNGHKPVGQSGATNIPAQPVPPDDLPYATPEDEQETTVNSGECSPESSPEGTNKLNITKLNITKLNENTTAPPMAVVVDCGSVFRLWENNMPGSLTPIITEELGELVDTYGVPEVELAINLAVKANKRNVRYVRGILVKRAEGDDRIKNKDTPVPIAVGVSGNVSLGLSSMRAPL